MARMETPSYIQHPSGRMGDIVIYTIGKRKFFRRYVVPRNPHTEGQRIVRRAFSDAVRSWQQLSAGEKEQYNIRAAKYDRKGYNLYISMFMKETTKS